MTGHYNVRLAGIDSAQVLHVARVLRYRSDIVSGSRAARENMAGHYSIFQDITV